MIRKLIQALKKKAKPFYYLPIAENQPLAEPNQPNQLVRWTSGQLTIEKTPDMRIDKKPIEVISEIVTELPQMDLRDLDKKIKAVEERLKCFRRVKCSGVDEVMALNYLKARKKFIKYQSRFNWTVTTLTKANELCQKYKLRIVELTGYYKSLPMEAVEQLENFVNAFELVAEVQPYFKLIIDDGGKEQKKDPILLAASPFGNWFYILGAWDKEVEYVDELIYKGK